MSWKFSSHDKLLGMEDSARYVLYDLYQVYVRLHRHLCPVGDLAGEDVGADIMGSNPPQP